MDDRQLVRQLLARDEEAERLFFRTYRDKLYKACVYLLGYKDPEAEDVTQEAFIVALRRLPEFEFRSSLYTWLYRICVNLCYDRIDKRWRLVESLQEELEAFSRPVAEERLAREEEAEEKKKMLELVESQMARMGSTCRELLELRDKKGESYAGVSKVLKVPIGTVMSRLARCREALKRLVFEVLEGGTNG